MLFRFRACVCLLFGFFIVCVFSLDGQNVLGQNRQFVSDEDDAVIQISEGGLPVLTYQLQEKSLDGRWPRAGYVHPLYDLNGNVFTEDFPEDHGHHRGVFWAWHHLSVGNVQLGDPWICKDFVRECVQATTVLTPVRGLECMQIDLLTLWKSPLVKDTKGEMLPIVQEKTRLTIHHATEHHRLVDFDISLTAALGEVRIGGSDDVKGYGGFSPRIQLNPEQVFRFYQGEVEPQKTAVQGGPWVDISDGKRGLTIMSHPGNPVAKRKVQKKESDGLHHPPLKENIDSDEKTEASTLWILRRKRSMQNAVYPGRQPVPLSTEKPTRLKYRLVIHDGKRSADVLQVIYQQFAESR